MKAGVATVMKRTTSEPNGMKSVDANKTVGLSATAKARIPLAQHHQSVTKIENEPNVEKASSRKFRSQLFGAWIHNRLQFERFVEGISQIGEAGALAPHQLV